jgi:hypothetical protein
MIRLPCCLSHVTYDILTPCGHGVAEFQVIFGLVSRPSEAPGHSALETLPITYHDWHINQD